VHVTTGCLNEQVKRNSERFPGDFMFRLTAVEWEDLKPQFALSSAHGGRRGLPLAFTEHDAIMAANVRSSAQPGFDLFTFRRGSVAVMSRAQWPGALARRPR
jgi:hypothetical protein